MKPKIIVIGSSNTDMVVKVPHIPAPGETIMGTDFMTIPGGKGANQAVAAARAGADVTFIACVSDDALGKKAVENYRKMESILRALRFNRTPIQELH
jgi:ribokinase